MALLCAFQPPNRVAKSRKEVLKMPWTPFDKLLIELRNRRLDPRNLEIYILPDDLDELPEEDEE